jgi:hypothetical protein
MKNIVNTIFGYIFSGTTLLLLIGAVFVWFIIAMGNAESREQERIRQVTEACYNQGMVPVDTDAGQRCVLPQSLVKVK